jgi:hypothetical protein
MDLLPIVRSGVPGGGPTQEQMNAAIADKAGIAAARAAGAFIYVAGGGLPGPLPEGS